MHCLIDEVIGFEAFVCVFLKSNHLKKTTWYLEQSTITFKAEPILNDRILLNYCGF